MAPFIQNKTFCYSQYYIVDLDFIYLKKLDDFTTVQTETKEKQTMHVFCNGLLYMEARNAQRRANTKNIYIHWTICEIYNIKKMAC